MLDSIFGANPAIRSIQWTAARVLHRIGVTADVATIAAAISGVMAGVGFATDHVIVGIVLLAISAILDAIDGTIAREFGGSTSLFGGVMDLSFDRIVEAAVIVGIVWLHPQLDFYALLLVASWYVNITIFLAVGSAMERTGPKLIDYPPGILERTEALIFFAVLALVESARYPRWVGPQLCLAMTALEIVTGAQRFLFGRRHLRQ
ncbi:MAG TPA: CDP-alcohol phosphatidyltransferase family protein [Candidatus Binataceae bacterium]|jgi:archaetidylinositol phosphate synthase|nr:CDP-alcohol phosphatidyltransferase family protein [Candidatus Binataceae bacterium]